MISIETNNIMIEHYKEVIHVTSSEIKIRMKENIMTIKGKNLHVSALSKYEVFIQGTLERIDFYHDN